MTKMYRDILTKLASNPKRLFHVISVGLYAKGMAYHYHENSDDAFLAGLMHDYSKYETNDFHQKYIDEKTFDAIKEYPFLYHAYSAANYFKKHYRINNNIHDAVLNHVYGHANMNKITQMIFIADSIYKDTLYLYQKALENLNEATLQAITLNITNIKRKGLEVAKQQEITYNFYKDVNR